MTHPCLARIWKGLVSLLGMMLLVPLLMPGIALAVKSDQVYFDLEYLGIRTMALYRMVLDPDDSDFVEGEAFSQFSPGPGSSIARSEEGVVFRYQLIKERACRGRNEGGVHGRRTFAACAKLCIDDEDCISFEFGQVGGRKVRRCTISHSCTYEQSVPSGNYDLWILQRGIPGGDAGSVADEVPDTSAATAEVICDGSNPNAFNWEACQGEPWSGQNDSIDWYNRHIINPQCYGLVRGTSRKAWVVGLTLYHDSEYLHTGRCMRADHGNSMGPGHRCHCITNLGHWPTEQRSVYSFDFSRQCKSGMSCVNLASPELKRRACRNLNASWFCD